MAEHRQRVVKIRQGLLIVHATANVLRENFLSAYFKIKYHNAFLAAV